jgi:pimeloyl-[acyl-carrier protein] methyl ester esterase
MWGPWIDELARHARLHVLDLPGHGRSSWPEGLRDLPGLAGAVFPAVPRGAVLLGWSLGGMVALEIARRHPRDVAALALVATTPKFVAAEGWAHGMRRDVLDEFARGLAADYSRTVQNFLALQTRGDERSQETLRLLRSRLGSHGAPDLQALTAGLTILRESDLRDALPRIKRPTLVIAGDHDRLTPPAAGRALAEMLPDARFRLIERSGHAPFLSHAPEVLEEVRAFLEAHAAVASRSPACA